MQTRSRNVIRMGAAGLVGLPDRSVGHHVLFAYEYASASRIVYMDTKVNAPIETWMGYSSGRWDGETLVVDVTGFNDQTWFDRAGNFHSEALHVTERYTRVSPDALLYEATIEDPKVFTRA